MEPTDNDCVIGVYGGPDCDGEHGSGTRNASTVSFSVAMTPAEAVALLDGVGYTKPARTPSADGSSYFDLFTGSRLADIVAANVAHQIPANLRDAVVELLSGLAVAEVRRQLYLDRGGFHDDEALRLLAARIAPLLAPARTFHLTRHDEAQLVELLAARTALVAAMHARSDGIRQAMSGSGADVQGLRNGSRFPGGEGVPAAASQSNTNASPDSE